MATNISALTATEITAMPYDVTQNAGSSAVTLWFTYLAQANDQVLSIVYWSADTAQYHPRITFWQGPAVLPVRTPSWGTSTASNMQIVNLPVTTGTRYFFAIDDIDATNPPTEDLVLSVISSAQLGRGVSPNALIITDDSPYFPAVLVDPVTYHVVGFVPDFPDGETLASLPNGVILTEDDAANNAQLWRFSSTSGWQYQRTISDSIFNAGLYNLIVSNNRDRFYVSKVAVVTALDMHGTVVDTWTLASQIKTLAVNADDTVLYYVLLASNDVIRRWDLVNDVALSDFATYGLGVWYYASSDSGKFEIHVLDDGSVLTYWNLNGLPVDGTHAVRYSASGSILRVIDLDAL